MASALDDFSNRQRINHLLQKHQPTKNCIKHSFIISQGAPQVLVFWLLWSVALTCAFKSVNRNPCNKKIEALKTRVDPLLNLKGQ